MWSYGYLFERTYIMSLKKIEEKNATKNYNILTGTHWHHVY
jgi:hypothetical protein